MRIEAMLTHQDVTSLLQGFAPLELEMGTVGTGERMLRLDELGSVELVPDIGIRVRCSGHLSWPVLGIEVPVKIREATVMIQPSVQSREGDETLVFHLSVENADIGWVPAAFERGITEKVNRELTEHRVELAWDFTQTLTHVFKLPEALRTAEALGLEVAAGRVRITATSLGLSVAFRASVSRRAPAAP